MSSIRQNLAYPFRRVDGEPPAAKIEVYKETETRTIISSTTALTWPSIIPSIAMRVRAWLHLLFQPFTMSIWILAQVQISKERRGQGPLEFCVKSDEASWKGNTSSFRLPLILMPLEANYKLTRACLEVCAEFRIRWASSPSPH
jgi:hypothetical protein